jgi:hypothetical protein
MDGVINTDRITCNDCTTQVRSAAYGKEYSLCPEKSVAVFLGGQSLKRVFLVIFPIPWYKATEKVCMLINFQND